jgi:hypothetical protein
MERVCGRELAAGPLSTLREGEKGSLVRGLMTARRSVLTSRPLPDKNSDREISVCTRRRLDMLAQVGDRQMRREDPRT